METKPTTTNKPQTGGFASRKPEGFRPRRGGDRKFTEREKPEFDQKIISIRRVTRVVTGGRRFAFSVAVVIGDRKGRVGVGQGKASDTPVAIDGDARVSTTARGHAWVQAWVRVPWDGELAARCAAERSTTEGKG